MKRIGYLISQYPAVNHTFILREIRALRALGWDVRVVSVRPADRNRDQMSREEIEEWEQTYSVIGAGKRKALAVVMREFLRGPARFLCGLWNALNLAGLQPGRWPIDLIYFLEAVVAAARFREAGVAHVHTHFSSTVALLMAHFSGISFSMTVHGPTEFDRGTSFHMAEKAAKARLMIAISCYAASQIMRATAPEDWDKVEVAPLGIDPEVFAPRPAPEHDQGQPYELLMVGRLAPVKAQWVLLDVLERLRERQRAVRLTLVGEGPLRPVLEQRIRERGLAGIVELTGPLHHERVLNYYRKADFFVLPSFAEGVPVVLMEAMAMEIPCVATWVMGIPELIQDGSEGLLAAPADIEGLVERVDRLIGDQALCRRLGQAGRTKVRQKYDLNRNVETLSEIFVRYGLGQSESTGVGS